MKVAISKSKLDSLAVKIAAKSGETLPLTLDEMEDAVDGISGGGANIPVFTVDYPNVTCNMTYAECRVFAIRDDYDTSALLNCSASCVVGFTLSMALCRFTQSSMTYVVYDSDGIPFGEITYSQDGTIALVESTSLLATLNATSNGTYTPSSGQLYNEVNVNVPSSQPVLETIEHVTPTESSQTITPDTGYDALSSVQIDPISSSYVGSGVTRRSSTDLTASGATVTVPAGYYASQASKAVASGTEGTPSAIKGTVSNHAVTVTPSVTNGAGYIAGGTHSGTGVSVSASELVSGTLNVDSSGTKDVTNYASASIPAGTVTAPSTISGTSATVSTGTNTLTLTKTVSVTPNVSTAGYINSGTAGNASVSLQASVTTKAAATIHPSTSDQSIASGTYTTGAQTIKAVTTSNLTAENIKSGVVVQIGDSTDADCVASITGTYSGGGSSKNVQTAQSTTRRNNTALGSIISLTCSTAGTYDVYWTCARSNTSQTWGSQLYIGGAAYGTEDTTWSNNVQNNHLTGVTIAANQTVAVYGRSRSGYYIYAPQLTIVQTA